MATLTTMRFTQGDISYEVNIDFDDEGIVENLLAFDVIAKLIDKKGHSYSATLRIAINLDEFSGRIFLGEKELHKFSFGDMNVRMDGHTRDEIIPGLDGDGKFVDSVYDNIQEGIGNAVAEIIDGMPVPDPVFGCLIKASISSIVGQVITCNELRGNYGKGKRYRQILRCLGEHTKGIAFRSIYRAARCMIRFGF